MKLEITKENALKAYNKADDKGKQLLSSLLGEQVFIPEKITDRVKTYEDACTVLGIDSDKNLCPVESEDQKSIIAYSKLIIIARALNEGRTPNWGNSNECKYYPWFKMSGSGFGLSCDDYGYSFSDTTVGSRLCFQTREL